MQPVVLVVVLVLVLVLDNGRKNEDEHEGLLPFFDHALRQLLSKPEVTQP